MVNLTLTRTLVGSIQNQKQVGDELDSLGIAASKLWNVARWTIDRIRDKTGDTPGDDVLKSYLKNHYRYRDLHAQSSQRAIEELAEAFQSWFTSVKDNPDANPPGYKKYGETYLYSTVTFKQAGFKCDPKYNRVRLSKGRNLKDHFSDFILCEYELRPGVSLSDVKRIQQVRAVLPGVSGNYISCIKLKRQSNQQGNVLLGYFSGGRTR